MTYRTIGLLITLALGLLVVSLAVAAQPSTHVPRIGLLSIFSPALGESKAESFRQGLRELGYMEGHNILLESRWAEGHRERLAELAADLVRMKVAVIVTESTPSALAAKQATDTIPIVMATSGNPVADGLVASLARPGGSVTGLTMFTPELSGQRLQLLTEVAPQTLLVQTASKFPCRWWGANSTLSDRHQLDELPAPHSAQNEAPDVPEPRYVNSRGYTDLVRSASFPTGVNGILTRFAPWHMTYTA
jgi:hypothetical protein